MTELTITLIPSSVCVCVCVWSVTQLCLPLCGPVDCSLPVSSVHEIFQAKILDRVAFPIPEDIPDPGIKPMSPALAGGFSTSATREARSDFMV